MKQTKKKSITKKTTKTKTSANKKKSARELFHEICRDSWIFPVATIGVVFYWPNKELLFIVLLLYSGLLLLQKKSSAELRLYLTVGIIAPFVEMIAIWGGAWMYATPQFLGVPLWLFPLWGIAAIFMYRNAKTIGLI